MKGLRQLADEQVYARVNNFVMPWFGIICPPDANGPTTVFFSTPVDDVTHRAWFVHYNPHRELGMTVMSASPDVWNFPPLPPGTAAENWGQNRDIMEPLMDMVVRDFTSPTLVSEIITTSADLTASATSAPPRNPSTSPAITGAGSITVPPVPVSTSSSEIWLSIYGRFTDV